MYNTQIRSCDSKRYISECSIGRPTNGQIFRHRAWHYTVVTITVTILWQQHMLHVASSLGWLRATTHIFYLQHFHTSTYFVAIDTVLWQWSDAEDMSISRINLVFHQIWHCLDAKVGELSQIQYYDNEVMLRTCNSLG